MTQYAIKSRTFVLGSSAYNRAIVYKRQNFLKVVVHVIIKDQCNQHALDVIQATVNMNLIGATYIPASNL